MSNNPKNILFRADSSSTIGTGHIMRDLVLAAQFKDANIIFATQELPGNINHKIEEKDYVIEILNSNDVEELDALIKKLSIDMIVIDHYGIDHNFEKQLKTQNSKLKIFSLDDTYEKHYCDILLNHNISADASKYKGLVPNNCEIRCGSEYTLLRQEFIEEKQKHLVKDDSKTTKTNIFLAMGGADHSNITLDILKSISVFNNIHINIVTTTANKNLNNLQSYVENKSNMTLHINTAEIAYLMSISNLAIVSPSVILNEIIYMEVPFIAIKTAQNQIEMYKYLVDMRYPTLETFSAESLQKQLKGFLDA